MRKAGKGPALHLEWLRRRVFLVGVVKVAGTAVRKPAETAMKARYLCFFLCVFSSVLFLFLFFSMSPAPMPARQLPDR